MASAGPQPEDSRGPAGRRAPAGAAGGAAPQGHPHITPSQVTSHRSADYLPPSLVQQTAPLTGIQTNFEESNLTVSSCEKCHISTLSIHQLFGREYDSEDRFYLGVIQMSSIVVSIIRYDEHLCDPPLYLKLVSKSVAIISS